MTDSPLPLSPDDDQQDNMVFDTATPPMPYAWVSFLTFVGTLLLVRFMLPWGKPLGALIFAGLLGLLLFLLLELTRPQICPVTITVVSAVFGVILALPVPVFRGALCGELLPMIILAFWATIAAFVGWLGSRWLDARTYPTLVPPIAFLLLLVGASLWHLVS